MATWISGRRLWVAAVVITGLDLTPTPLCAEEAEAAFRPTDIEDPSGRALDRFFSALQKTASKQPGATTRIAHYGDSVIVGDIITRYLRRHFQARYGDGGPGFILAGQPWDWYRHAGVKVGATNTWKTYRGISGGPPDHWYGFGGVTFETHRPGERVWYVMDASDGCTIKASSLEVQYMIQPGGGDLEVTIDSDQPIILSTKGERPGSAFHTLQVPDGQHNVVLRTVGNGPVRLFGVSFGREGPGVIYDALGVNNACTTMLGRMDAAHMADQYRHIRPDLIVLSYGANESNRPGLVARYRSAVLPAVRRLVKASAGASCLIMAPMDRGWRTDEGGGKVVNDMIPTIVEAQREIASEAGCAFFDTFEGMGGQGSIRRWAAKGLAGGDQVHPTKLGGALIAQHLFEALERAFRQNDR
jgi:lysophospholipase L1-like esterase